MSMCLEITAIPFLSFVIQQSHWLLGLHFPLWLSCALDFDFLCFVVEVTPSVKRTCYLFRALHFLCSAHSLSLLRQGGRKNPCKFSVRLYRSRGDGWREKKENGGWAIPSQSQFSL